MNVAVMTLMGSLAVGGPAEGGPLPVPGAGPHAAVAGSPPPALLAPVPFRAPAIPAPAPLLAAKVIAPKGVRVTAYPASPLARMFDTPAVLGLRPGYIYRFELSNLPFAPGRTLYPEVEIRGTLVPRPGMKYMDWPTPLYFTANDIERALLGAVISKAIYLEDPEKAIPAEFGLNAPVELPVDTEQQAIKDAIASGRLVAILRLGNRKPDAEWLKATAIDGTILLPGDNYLKSPQLPPMLPYYAAKLFDPLLGPRGFSEECFTDGGDTREPLGIGVNNRLGGLNPTDVGVEFTVGGKRKVTTSNIVCLCVPRFAIQRAEIAPELFDLQIGMRGLHGTHTPQGFRERAMAMAEIGREKPVGVLVTQRPRSYIGPVGTSFFIGSSRPSIIGQVEGVAVTGAVVEPEVLTAYPGAAPLTISKSVDSSGPVEAGSTVTFTIRFLNTGNKAITDLVVNDSLSGRLEYLPGTNQSDRAANFSATANEAGSVIVRWELPGTLLPGQGGTVKFKAKVR
jgi:uncharacterized repeat protein (TIGR01451 family)